MSAPEYHSYLWEHMGPKLE